MEEYYDLIGYEGLYKINKNGNILSCKKNIIMKCYPDKDGYLKLCLTKDKIEKKYFLHRLLAIQFVPNDDPINNTVIDHIDRNKTNNNIDNLRWASISLNMKNKRFSKGTRPCNSIDRRRGKNTIRNYFQASITYYDENNNRIIKHKKSKDKYVVDKWYEEMCILYPVSI